jgi:hypothetical protein
VMAASVVSDIIRPQGPLALEDDAELAAAG